MKTLICNKCEQPLGGPVTGADGCWYHSECFHGPSIERDPKVEALCLPDDVYNAIYNQALDDACAAIEDPMGTYICDSQALDEIRKLKRK